MARTTRKPVDEVSKYGSRDAVWIAVRKMKRFTVRELQRETTLRIDTVRDYVTGLTNAGYLEEDGEVVAGRGAARHATAYRLVRDAGVEAPRVRRDGSPVTAGRVNENLWRTMNILGTFTITALAISAATEDCPVKRSTAENYVQHLHRAGYLWELKRGAYRLPRRRYTGPKPPMVQRVKTVFDPNLGRVVWSEKEADGGNW